MGNKVKKILTIDDNQDNLVILKALIVEAFPDVAVLSALNGQKGLEIAAKEEPEIILLDIIMPGMDGYEVCRKLKADTKLFDIPVVFITAIESNKESRIRALECGAEGFLTKPIDESELAAQIRAMFKIQAASVYKKNENERLAVLVKERTQELEKARNEAVNLLEALKKENEARKDAQSALIKSEAKYRQIAENISDVVWTTDKNLNTTYISPSVEQMLGITPEVYMKRALDEKFTPASLKIVRGILLEPFEKEKDQKADKNRTKEIEAEHYRADGSVIWISMHISFIRDKNGKVIGYQGVSRDITVRKHMEEHLKQNVDDLLISQRIAHIGTWRLDLATNHVVWSEELYRMYGFDPTIPPPPYTEHMKLFTPESWNRLSTSLERTSTLGIPYELELETVTKEGMNGWMWVRGEAEKNSQGIIITLRGAAQDITERKKTENRLKRSEEKFQLLFNQAPLAYLALDSNACFVEVNQKWLDTFGYNKEEVIGRWMGDFLCPEYVEAFRKRFEVFKSQGFVQSEVELYCKDGRRLLIAFEGRIAYDAEGIFKQTHGIMQDITEHRKTEKALMESESRYRQLSEQSRTFTWETDAQGLYTFVDQVSEKVLGYRPEELIRKKHFYDLCPDDERETLKQTAFETFRQKGLFNNLENKALTKTGTLLALSTNGFPILKENGSLLGYRGSDTDITTRKQIENERRKFFLIIESSSEFIGMCDFDMNPIYVNPAGQRMVGLPDMATACQVKVQDYFFPEDQRFIAEEFFPRVLKEGHGDVEIRLRHFHTGEPIWMFYNLFSVLDDKGTPVGWATVSRDITRQKETENELRSKSKQIQRILENLQDAYFQVDLFGKVMMVNPSAAHLFGYNNEEMTGLPAENLYADANDRSKLLEELKSNGSVQEYLVKRLRKDGSEFWGSMNAQYIKNELDEIVGIEGLMRDVSERIKFIEDLERQQKELEQRLHQSVNAISKIGEIKDAYTSGHQKRVAELACAIGSEMGLTNERINALSIGGLIHDIGKFFIPSDILNKPGKITDLEYEILQAHAEESYNVVKQIDFPAEIPTMIHQHHERLDGTGYPQGLSGNEIILESRILAVADVVEAMNSHRPYRPALGIDAALEEILRYRGTKYDAKVVDVCMKLFKEKGFAFQSS